MDVIGGKLFSNKTKNPNHVHKYSKYLLYVIINMEIYIRGGDTVFYDGLKPSDLGSRYHVLKHLHGRMIFGPFEKEIHEGTLFRGHRAVISFIITKKTYIYIITGIIFITKISIK